MILFYNVLVTDRRASASGLNRADRLDVFKYALASLACIDRITEVIIFYEMEGSYKAKYDELEGYVREIFAGKPISFYRRSPSNQKEWQTALVEVGLLLTSKPILYMGNDDHVFIDYDLEVLNEGLDLMAAEPKDQINTIHISSWTEAISTTWGINSYTRVGRYWVSDLLYPDACQIVNSLYFKHFFFDLSLGNDYMRRTDEILTNWYPYLGDYKYPSVTPHPVVKTFIPLRELVRHFDAYWHINVPLQSCPMLSIPFGFFENKISIKYHGVDGLGYYGWGPFSNDRDKKMIADIPLFWQDRVVCIENSNYGLPRELELEARNAAHRLMMTTPHTRGYQTPFARTPAIWPKKYRATPDSHFLPLNEEDIKVGYRT